MAAAARAGENVRVPPEEHPPADWADACQRILDAGSDGIDRVHVTLASAARRLAGAAGSERGGVGARRRPPARGQRWRAAPSGPSPRGGRHGGPDRGRRLGRRARRDRPRRVVEGIDTPQLRPARTAAAACQARPPTPAGRTVRHCRRSTPSPASCSASRDREEVLLGLATAAADVLDAEIAGVFLATPDGAHLEAQAVVGHRSMATARLRLARGESMVGHVFATGEVYRSDDWTTDPVISKELLPVATVEGTKACIGAPMRLDGAVVGVLAAWRRRRSVYTDDDVARIGTLADLAALGVARALDDDRLRDLSDQLMTANSELARRYEETRQTLEIHRRLMRVVVDGADLGSVVEALRAITGQEVAFVGLDAACAGGWLEALIAKERDGTAIGEEAALAGPRRRGAGRRSRSTSGRPVSAGAGSRSPPGRRRDAGRRGHRTGRGRVRVAAVPPGRCGRGDAATGVGVRRGSDRRPDPRRGRGDRAVAPAHQGAPRHRAGGAGLRGRCGPRRATCDCARADRGGTRRARQGLCPGARRARHARARRWPGRDPHHDHL